MPEDVNPQHILTSVKNCMELLLRLYFLHHGFEFFEMILIHLILHTGFIYLKEHLATAKTANSSSPHGSTSNSIPSDLEQDSEWEDYDASRSLVAVQLRSAWPGGDFDLDDDVERFRLSNRLRDTVETAPPTGPGVAGAPSETDAN
ncbi:uncharacterized protein B0I36DRAFT_364167 [Microdochium trichocladiopsis]|uniref:Uncharacterized protein n=1 Tax=Microdochium trichocladiopsis TaxID=1682393 RepID=A0A9P8Y5Y0_9PEZI|nr:uncharacterized protein B0I36DRAFT_364167 [Microdochium trichocladiopsis]KAH7029655.1 hypothetical protein B0I36DRAFT_364167 [Microdochium trichocladiopsis]